MDPADRANPYAPPAADSTTRPARANVDDATALAIRRATLGREAVARLAGTLLIVAAAVGIVAAVAMTVSDYAMLVQNAVDDAAWAFWERTVPIIAVFVAPVLATAVVGIGLRFLRRWSYHGGLVLSVLVVALGLPIALSSLRTWIGRASFWLYIVVVGLTMLISLRFWSRVPFVFSPEYRAIVARTRQVRPAWHVDAEVALVVLGLAVAGLVAAAILR
jgi:hypothetical protein